MHNRRPPSWLGLVHVLVGFDQMLSVRPKLAELRPTLVRIGERRPKPVKSGQASPSIGQCWPGLHQRWAEFGQARPKVPQSWSHPAQIWPENVGRSRSNPAHTLANLCQGWLRLDQMSPKLSRLRANSVELAPNAVESGPDLAELGQVESGPKLVEFDRFRPHAGQNWVRSGQIWAIAVHLGLCRPLLGWNLVRRRPNLAELGQGLD